MVLSEEPCEKGKDCKDSECTKSRVSPAPVLANKQDPVDFSAGTRTVLTLHVPSGTRTRMGTLSLHQLLSQPKTSRTRLNRLGVRDQDFRPTAGWGG
jgi:hypothetical protein